jgi:hypothetical protein
MSDPSFSDAQVIRVQRVLEETLDRYAGQDESERAEALARTLRAELSALPAATRAPLLGALVGLYPEPPVVPTGAPAGDGHAQRRLEQENERLRVALAAAQARPEKEAAPTPVASGGALYEEIGRLLVGPARRGAPAAVPGAEQRMVGVLRALVDFASSLARGYLSVGLDPDKTMAGHLHVVIADELEGKRPAGSVKGLFEQMRQQIGSQVMAFREACEAGSRELLGQLDPESIGAEAEKSRLFQNTNFRKILERRYGELINADNIFETYFDVAFQRTMRSLLKQSSRPGRGE